MVNKKLAEKDYLPILKGENTATVIKDGWQIRRSEMLSLLEKYSYGKIPSPPVTVMGRVTKRDETEYAGKVVYDRVEIEIKRTDNGKAFTFPIQLYVPKGVKKPPVFLHIAFRPAPDQYIPAEEITDSGYALAVMVYTDVMNDNYFGDFSGGISELLSMKSERGAEDIGKISAWAYAASRVLDYLCAERDDIDSEKAIVIGHSRLGKTALWCGANDSRFFGVVSNNSGYGGAASSKKGKGERVTDFIRVGSFDWYCENFKLFKDEKEDEKPYDQSFLLALIAPRYLCIGSAELDRGADPEAEFLTACHASSAWELLGKEGLVTRGRMAEVGDHFIEGNIGYHLRAGKHYLSRDDWGHYIRFFDKKLKEEQNK